MVMHTAFIQDCAVAEIVDRQRAVIGRYTRDRGISIDRWVNAGHFDPDVLRAGEVLLVEKTFRLARDVRTLSLLLAILLKKGVTVCSCADRLILDGADEMSAEMARLFGMIAEIADEMHSQLTKEGLEVSRAAGRKPGRPRGRQSRQTKLTGRDEEIAGLLAKGCTRAKIARDLCVDPRTLNGFIRKIPALRELVDV